MKKKGYVSWHDYENHQAMNLMGAMAFVGGVVYVVWGVNDVRTDWIVGGLLLVCGGCMGIPRLRRWTTRGRLSNVSVWDRVIGRTLFMLSSGIGILVAS
ncbi:hypothetical protein [Halocatena pleomorpha]|uniref:Uncharacterized protein n=1 Tax=Halocatena pleomorpha TaxID=1785090 RepID=A0A3P3RAC0_9EURY|nr:hypothetical protein [Halocatena pleomorpha]RRJ30354.1 hypothetical protein EIK79_10575 [Halocatena pleomorpha]